MPIATSYPGVYIQEIASGVRTINGVSTSIAAFVGRAQRGVINQPVTLNGYGDFEREFGGLWLNSPMSYAVADFFQNGGSQAIVVRLHNGATTYAMTIGAVKLAARSPGLWGLNLRATVAITDVAGDLPNQFNLLIRDLSTGRVETFRNLTLQDGPQRVDKVLTQQSSLVAWSGTVPPATAVAPTAGDDPVGFREKALAVAVASGVAADISLAQAALDAARAAAALGMTDGAALTVNQFVGPGLESAKQGLYALKLAELFNLLCLPPHHYAGTSGDIETSLISAAAAFCESRRAILIVDPPSTWNDKATARTQFTDPVKDNVGTRSRNAALYFPRVVQPNPLRGGQLETFVACGAVAGVIARTDATSGLWKAAAGQEATLLGVPQLGYQLTDAEIGELNPLGINCLRLLPGGLRVVWGARTLQGDDRLASDWKYLPVRRLALYIEESLYRGTQWAVFEPNAEPLWAQLRLSIGNFMQDLFRQGAFQGQRPADAYFVKCDAQTTTPSDINQGVVNVIVGFAPVKPAEFIVIQLQQLAGQSA
jgi:phage tail sheath protein FI